MRYRKKPVVIEAMQWDGGVESGEEISKWSGGVVQLHAEKNDPRPPRLVIPTLEGVMTASPGDFIIAGLKFEFYPCKPDIFAASYEAVTD